MLVRGKPIDLEEIMDHTSYPLPAPSLATNAVFLAIVLFLALGLPTATYNAARQIHGPGPQPRKLATVAGVAMMLWLALTGMLAARGLLHTDGPPPAPFQKLMVASAVLTAVLALTRPGRLWVTGLPLWILVGFQGFRLPLELVLWALHRQGALPIQMTLEGSNFDVLSGLLALPLAFWLRQGQPPRAIVWAWNVLGLGLLVNIVQIAVRSTPGVLRAYVTEPPNVLVFGLPYVWLPTICVLAALLGHLLVFRAMLQQKPNT